MSEDITVQGYPEGARFGWDLIDLTDAEMVAIADYADAGMFGEAEAIVDAAENRMYGGG